MNGKLRGVFTFLITPFEKADFMKFDEDGLRQNVRYLRDKGVHVLVPCGGTGEIYSLTAEECKRIIEIVSEERGNRSSARNTYRHAEDVEADAVLVFPPHYISEGRLYRYYRKIADSTDINLMPFILGGLEKALLKNPEFVNKILEIEQVSAFKYESTDLWTLGKLMNLAERKVNWICDPNFLARVSECYFRLGASGFTDGISNFAPQLPIRLYECAINGRWDEFKEVEDKLAKLTDLRSKVGSVAFVKAALDLIGLSGGAVRPPLTQASEEEISEIKNLLSELGIL
ncbi:dihydrodipicolinate synthase family protein [Candidatus Bathyarchaeota archaeon]|nr:dihydrodipicolinate synthase family protein [Candidatus Bathyarchaeota archaeon]